MSEFKFNGSEEAHTENLNLFSLPSVNSGILATNMIEYKPVSQVIPGGPVEFQVTPPTYVDLSKSRIRWKIRLENGDGTEIGIADLAKKPKKDEVLDPNVEVGPVNALFYSLWNQVDFSLSQVNLSTALTTNGYAYKNYLDLLTSKPSHTKRNVLFIPDSSTAPGARTPYAFKDDPGYGNNDGLTERTAFLTGSNKFTMEGPLGLDMFEQDRLLLHSVPISLKFFPNTPYFYLMSPNNQKGFRAVVLDATLLLCQVTVNGAVVLGVDNTLKAGQEVLYPINRSIFKTYTISQGSSNATFDSVFTGDCPESLIVAMVNSNGFSGSLNQNPFNLQHFQCNSISFSYNGVSVPSRPLTPKFATTVERSDITEAYARLLKKNPEMNITQQQFINGCTLFYFDLSDNFDPDIIPLSKDGHTRLEISFKSELEQSVNVLLYAKKTGLIKIDEGKNLTIE